MANRHSSRGQGKGQSADWRTFAPVVRGVARLVLFVALGLIATGCTSIYRRAQAQCPPTQSAELALRLSEAQKAEQITRQTAERLCGDLKRTDRASYCETDFDRLEVAAFDLDRRVLTARDMAERFGEPGAAAAEIGRLGRQAQSWLEFVQNQRTSDPTTRLKALEVLLLQPVRGSPSH
jgi:hypothetical protein